MSCFRLLIAIPASWGGVGRDGAKWPAMQPYSWRFEDGVGRLSFNHPPVNVLTTAMLNAMAAEIERARAPRLLIVNAVGTGFSAGMDIREHLPRDVRAMLGAVRRFFEALWRLECPVIAAVHGRALGGAMEMLLLCDVVVASDDATFGFPEVRVGAYPPLAVLLLPRLLSWPRAAALLLEGHTINADTACAWGLVNVVVARAELEAATARQIERLLALSPVVQRHIKRAMRTGDDLFERLTEVENAYLEELMQTEDALEGLLAFIEKRRPCWRGR